MVTPKLDIDHIRGERAERDSDRLVIENERTTYRILSKSVREYHFIVPYDSYQDRVEVGQIFSIRDRDLTFLARILNIEHSSNYDGHWDTTMRGTQFYDDDQIFNRVIAEPLGCVSSDGAFRKARHRFSMMCGFQCTHTVWLSAR